MRNTFLKLFLPVVFLLWAFSAALQAQPLPGIFKVPFTIGGQFYDYQNYHQIPYFHGGMDLCAPAGTDVYAPVEGTVKVFSYKIAASASPHRFTYTRQAFYKQRDSNTRYLEVAIEDKNQTLWMLRHIDPRSIPAQIFAKVRNQQKVYAGDYIGKVGAWIRPVLPEPALYDHIHLEIIASDGRYLNPADYVATNQDYYPPLIHKLFLVKHGSDQAFNGSLRPVVHGKIDVIAMVNDRMNRSAYQHAVFAAKYSLEKINDDESFNQVIEEQQAYKFSTLPFTGERIQLSKVIYRDQIYVNRRRFYANANDGPRIFLLNLTAGTVKKGYSASNCLDTRILEDGLYRLNVTVADQAGNTRQSSINFFIKNSR